MNDIKTRLTRCFAAVFPGLDESEIDSANMKSVSEWDSIGALNLLMVIEEEFAVEIPADDIGALASFEQVLDYLQTRNGA